jgi:opacity protein-like surface antigen
MRRFLVLAFVGFLAAGFAVAATPAGAQEYDRYERGTAAPPPPPAPPPPAKYRAAPPPPRPAGFHAGPYFFGNIGIFEPSDYYADYYGTYNLSGYSSGLSGNVGFGSRLSPFAAIEGTVGYFSAERGSDEASVVPVTLGGRLILPHPMFEPYMGAGVGVYFASLKENPFFYNASLYYPGTDDDDTTIGGYFSLGMDFWLSPKIALNLEGRYQMVEPTFTDNLGGSFDLDMSGWELNFGFRVNF